VSFKIIVDPASSTVTLRVPLATFGEGDPAAWAYTAAVLGQEGYPSTGVWRVRDVNVSCLVRKATPPPAFGACAM